MNNPTLEIPSLNIAGRLVVNGQTFPVGQVCGHSLILLEECELPSGDAELIVTVRGRDRVYPIFIPHGSDGKSFVISFF